MPKLSMCSVTFLSYPILGYLQSRPYGWDVVKRETHDGRYIKAIEVLRAARKQLGISQTALAAKLGKRQQFVSKYESGERRLDVIEFLDVAKALGLTTASVVSDLGDNF